jgi:hypothetical protein
MPSWPVHARRVLALHLDRHGAVFNDFDNMSSISQESPRSLRIQMHAADFEPEFSGPAFELLTLADGPCCRGQDIELAINWWPGLPRLAIVDECPVSTCHRPGGAPLNINEREMTQRRHSIRTIADRYHTLCAELLPLKAGKLARVGDLRDPKRSSGEVNP